ncbi:MAG: argininosuccinate synthase [Gammaproteobacteria bacterium TMED78]|nr:MAG: argininosuccinate synthase [Gammaproteobacteria bacterium TMED78]|tara:strand:- start:183448 stop:184659 length:1212 start_codon:yes stop_codon:yes gene_type:complete
MANKNSPIILAFSGGLDTSFCVPWLKETYGKPVITVTVDTGGINKETSKHLKEHSKKLGANDHILVNAKDDFFNDVLKFLIMGNIKKGNMYPLCVGSERVIQAKYLAKIAKDMHSDTVAHGCTAAGNDQIRFQIILKSLAPDLKILAPVRDQSWARDDQVSYLKKLGLPTPKSGSTYSINRGLWGVTIGGSETLDSKETIPESSWELSPNVFPSSSKNEQKIIIEFKKGIPIKINGEDLNPIQIIEKLETTGKVFGIGRGIHLGDTILGIKGRVAFEAPAAEILINAHRELEKLTLSSLQLKIKEQLSLHYCELIHEGKQLDPACNDIESFFMSSQKYVSGKVDCVLRPGSVFITGIKSPFSLMSASKSKYGESIGEWDARDALGFSRILSLPGTLHSRVKES